MFLIDDDQAGVRQGREYGRAGAEHDARAAVARAKPCAGAFAFGQVRVQHFDRHTQAFAQASHRLRRQGDLWYIDAADNIIFHFDKEGRTIGTLGTNPEPWTWLTHVIERAVPGRANLYQESDIGWSASSLPPFDAAQRRAMPRRAT